jgi:hypothetical protein
LSTWDDTLTTWDDTTYSWDDAPRINSLLPVSVWIAPGADPTADPGDWTWTEITDDVRVAGGIVVEAGRGDEAARVDPGKCKLSLNNRSGNYSPRNPLGTWYGQLSKNTPLQVRLHRATDTFTRTLAAGGWGTEPDSGYTWTHTTPSYFSVDGSAGLCALPTANVANWAILTGANGLDADVVSVVSLSAAPTGAAWVSATALRYTDINNAYRLHTEFQADGTIQCGIVKHVNGVNTTLVSLLPTGITGYTANTKIRTRAQCDGPTLRIRAWLDGTTEPTTWTCEVDDNDLSGSGTGFYQWRVFGNTNVGTLTAAIDSFDMTAVLFTGSVAEWPVKWDRSGNDCVTTIEASGILRRLQQGSAALRSPLYRQLTRYNPAGYWPLEDGSDSTAASSAVSGGQAATVVDVTFADDDTLPGGETSLKLNSAGSSVRGHVSLSTGAGFAAMFLSKLAALPASKTTLIEWTGTGAVRKWRISGDNLGVYVEGLDYDGTVLTGGTGPIYVVDPTSWVAWQLEATVSAGTVSWAFIWHQVGSQVFYVYNSTYSAATVGRISDFLIPGSTGLVDAAFSHVWAGADTLPFVDDTFSLVSDGYAGELAADRVSRLCAEEGVRVAVTSGTSQAMGRQRATTFLELLQACEDADVGVLYERGTALAYLPSGARYNPTTDIALNFDSGHIAAPPEPTDDDQRVHNDITAQRDDGAQVRVTDDTHIALNGQYSESVTVNVQADSQLADQAGWRLHLGTWDEMRWPRIELDLTRNPSLIPYILGARVGTRVTIANPPDQVVSDDIDVLIEGFSQTLTPYSWDVALSCSPARPWDVGIYDDDGSRYANADSSLASGATSSATSLSVASSDLWTVDPAAFPFNIGVAGERMTVTAISGASSPQTFSVTRAVNGVVKAQASGAAVQLWSPVYYAF